MGESIAHDALRIGRFSLIYPGIVQCAHGRDRRAAIVAQETAETFKCGAVCQPIMFVDARTRTLLGECGALHGLQHFLPFALRSN